MLRGVDDAGHSVEITAAAVQNAGVEPIEVAPGVRVPVAALEMRSVRASGPGGQNVNKVASRVELLVDATQIEGLPEGALERLYRLAGRRRLADGRLKLSSQESRDRHRNLELTRERLAQMVTASLTVPKKRRPTGPSRAARERRLTAKKREGRVKALRKSPPPET